MAMAKRLVLFFAVNIAVMITINIILMVLGVNHYVTRSGIDYNSLLIFCLVWGMGGSLISLAISRIIAKWTMGVKVIDPNTHDPQARALLNTVYTLARRAGLPKMPEVGIYDSPEVNAFATGPTKSRALVAVSSGLLTRMSESEVEGVLGHEIAHVANGDMVTMTLVQGVVNAFVMFLSRVLAFAITQAMRGERDDRDRGGVSPVYFIVQFVLELGLMLLGTLVVAWFSRHREYRADKGGAQLAGRQKMVGALKALQQTFQLAEVEAQPAVQTLKISSNKNGFLRLFSTHPPLEDRIARLQSQLQS